MELPTIHRRRAMGRRIRFSILCGAAAAQVVDRFPIVEKSI
jgi:hypothetical protein